MQEKSKVKKRLIQFLKLGTVPKYPWEECTPYSVHRPKFELVRWRHQPSYLVDLPSKDTLYSTVFSIPPCSGS